MNNLRYPFPSSAAAVSSASVDHPLVAVTGRVQSFVQLAVRAATAAPENLTSLQREAAKQALSLLQHLDAHFARPAQHTPALANALRPLFVPGPRGAHAHKALQKLLPAAESRRLRAVVENGDAEALRQLRAQALDANASPSTLLDVQAQAQDLTEGAIDAATRADAAFLNLHVAHRLGGGSVMTTD